MESETKKQEFYLEKNGEDTNSEKPNNESVNEAEENDNNEDNDNVSTPMLNGKNEKSNKILYQMGDLDVEVVCILDFFSFLLN